MRNIVKVIGEIIIEGNSKRKGFANKEVKIGFQGIFEMIWIKKKKKTIIYSRQNEEDVGNGIRCDKKYAIGVICNKKSTIRNENNFYNTNVRLTHSLAITYGFEC